jgi:hypothetical protein
MSSTVFSTELGSDATLRLFVRRSGMVAAFLGFIVILTLPVDIAWRAAASLLWLILSFRELRIIRVAYSRYQWLKIDDSGGVELVSPGGEHHAATLLPSSVVLPGLAWLRLRSADGLCFGEFLRGSSHEDKQWRRLQVIWRHFGAA